MCFFAEYLYNQPISSVSSILPDISHMQFGSHMQMFFNLFLNADEVSFLTDSITDWLTDLKM